MENIEEPKGPKQNINQMVDELLEAIPEEKEFIARGGESYQDDLLTIKEIITLFKKVMDRIDEVPENKRKKIS